MKYANTKSNKGAANVLRDAEEEKPRIKPPRDMSLTEKALWMRIVNSLPHDHFFEHEVPVFVQYVRVLHKLDEITATLKDQDITVVDHHTRSERLNPIFNAMKHLAPTAQSLARQLRLVTGTTERAEQKTRGTKQQGGSAEGGENEKSKSKRAHLFGAKDLNGKTH